MTTHSVMLTKDEKLLIVSKRPEDTRWIRISFEETCRDLSEDEIMQRIKTTVKECFWVTGEVRCEYYEGVIEKIRKTIKSS